jgi:peptidoglycan hydrolase CwlO-like protein
MTMKTTLADYTIAWLSLASGLAISAVAVYYSVAGLVSIFAAAAIPIMIMGVVLELSKLVATIWLKQHWTVAPLPIRIYLTTAVLILMFITSVGIFGFLSASHSNQAIPAGDIQDRVAMYDAQILVQRENITFANASLAQLDANVNQVMLRTDDERGAVRASNIRRSQAGERKQLQADITTAQREISRISLERAPFAKQLRAVEAEVGPLKYIAAFVYGDDPDTNTLERAVRWVIILIVIIFDPLAVTLLLASQYSFAYIRQNREETPSHVNDAVPLHVNSADIPVVPIVETITETIPEPIIEPVADDTVVDTVVDTVIEQSTANEDILSAEEIAVLLWTPEQVDQIIEDNPVKPQEMVILELEPITTATSQTEQVEQSEVIEPVEITVVDTWSSLFAQEEARPAQLSLFDQIEDIQVDNPDYRVYNLVASVTDATFTIPEPDEKEASSTSSKEDIESNVDAITEKASKVSVIQQDTSNGNKKRSYIVKQNNQQVKRDLK